LALEVTTIMMMGEGLIVVERSLMTMYTTTLPQNKTTVEKGREKTKKKKKKKWKGRW